MTPTEEELDRLRAENTTLREVLTACIDSLAYVNDKHPETSGWSVREERITKARAALEQKEGPEGP